MNNSQYWISALTYGLVLVAVLINDISPKRRPNKVERAFRRMVSWAIFFCLQDTFWGLCDDGVIKSDIVFFQASSLFHISTVITTFFWLYYMLVYLEVKRSYLIICLGLDGLIILFEAVLIVINYFTPVLFSIHEGRYVTESLRALTFTNQYVVYFVTGLAALVSSYMHKRSGDANQRQRTLVVFVASLAPILLGVFQLMYPDEPFYSLGYFIACFLVHLFIAAKDREDNEKNAVYKSISNSYYSMHIIDFETGFVERCIESELLSQVIGKAENAQEMINRVIKATATEPFLEYSLEQVDLSTLSQRLETSNYIDFEFVGRNFGWTRMVFIPIEQKDGKLLKVMVGTQIIDSEKREKIDLIYKSNNDEQTGLFNRRAFERRIEELASKGMPQDMVVVTLDINGLKTANDTLGHAAGDELILGTAQCLKQCLSPYGMIFRTGGDEFVAFLELSETQVPSVCGQFQQAVAQWQGKKVDKLSVSCGFASLRESGPETNISDLVVLSDKRMYEAKTRHYEELEVRR